MDSEHKQDILQDASEGVTAKKSKPGKPKLDFEYWLHINRWDLILSYIEENKDAFKSYAFEIYDIL